MEEKSRSVEMVKVWGVVVAKSAVTTFQTIFFTITALLALFLLITLTAVEGPSGGATSWRVEDALFYSSF